MNGGAGKVAKTLFQHQSLLNDYKVEFYYKNSNSLWSRPFASPFTTLRAGLDDIFVKTSNRYFVSYFRNNNARKFVKTFNQDENIVHLHWLPGMLDFDKVQHDILRKKNFVWTLHDFEPITGGCHYNNGCLKFSDNCEKCPAVKVRYQKSIEDRFQQKISYFDSISNLIFVAPSNLVAEQLQRSKLGSRFESIIIENPIDEVFFLNTKKHKLNNTSNSLLKLGFVSSRVSEPRKNLNSIKAILNQCIEKCDFDIQLTIIGSGNNKLQADNHSVTKNGRKLEIKNLGYISNSSALAARYKEMDYLISFSSSETFGLTVAEAAACGTPSIIVDGTGTVDLISNGVNGIILPSISSLIDLFLSKDMFKDVTKFSLTAHEIALKRWSPREVLKKYESVYSKYLC